MSLLLTLSSGFFSPFSRRQDGWSEVARPRRSLEARGFVELLDGLPAVF